MARLGIPNWQCSPGSTATKTPRKRARTDVERAQFARNKWSSQRRRFENAIVIAERQGPARYPTRWKGMGVSVGDEVNYLCRARRIRAARKRFRACCGVVVGKLRQYVIVMPANRSIEVAVAREEVKPKKL